MRTRAGGLGAQPQEWVVLEEARVGVWGSPTEEGQPHVLLVVWVKSKHEDLGVLGEHQVASVFCAILWKRKPPGETMGMARLVPPHR